MQRPAALNLLHGDGGNHADLTTTTPPPPRFPNFHMDLPSPRAGDTPPALSPLDAFALRSRLLARRFEQEADAGRRLSRLPHHDVAKELANRPNYFRPQRGDTDEGSMSDIAESPDGARPGTSGGQSVKHQNSRHRPRSQYPTHGRISQLDNDNDDDDRDITAGRDVQQGSHITSSSASESDYFAFPRTGSPEPVDPRVNIEAPSPSIPSLTNSVESFSSSSQHNNAINRSERPSRSQIGDRSLQPLRSPLMPKSPRSLQSIRAVRQDSGDDESSSSPQPYSAPLSARKFSGSSGGMSLPQSPFTPSTTYHAHRSPSMTSEYSSNGFFSQSPRPPTMNFSRPDRPMSPDFVPRQSTESRQSFDSRDASYRHHHHHHNSSVMQFSSPPPGKVVGGAHVPRPFAANEEPTTSDSENGDATRTYTYSKYALPRGRGLDRSSMGFRTSWIEKQFTWDDDPTFSAPVISAATVHDRSSSEVLPAPTMPITMRPASSMGTEAYRPMPAKIPTSLRSATAAAATTTTTTRTTAATKPMVYQPSRPVERRAELDASSPTPLLGPASSYIHEPPKVPVLSHRGSASFSRPFIPVRPASPAQTKSTFEVVRGRHIANNSAVRSLSADTRIRPQPKHVPSPSVATDSTDRTVRAAPVQSSEVSAEDHLEIGIQAHSAGQTNKSTYHFRLAAKAGLPTAMLLYALACRHGWGMKANQEEGVKWLQKAIDTSKLDEQDVDQTLIAVSRRSGILDPMAEAAERRKRKAQFSVAIYELGMSYVKGWGCPKDPKLGLRCYEIAGDWGDCDALAEAGFCYTQGIGCKKDMYKAAALYRKAAGLGMSMTGNSWIYKDKYVQPLDVDTTTTTTTSSSGSKMGTDVTPLSTVEKEGRSRSKSLWHRSKKDKS